MHFRNWMISKSLLVCLCLKIKWEIRSTSYIEDSNQEKRETKRERALCFSSKQNELPFWINWENETGKKKSAPFAHYSLWTRRCCVSLLNYTSPFLWHSLWHEDVFCDDLFLQNVYSNVRNVLISLEVSSINILLFISLCWERYS